MIKEELDDNLFWMIKTWFENNSKEEIEFNYIVNNFIAKPSIDKEELLSILEFTEFNGHLIKFVDFIYNNVTKQEIDNNDYIDRFIEILKQVIYKQKIKGVH